MALSKKNATKLIGELKSYDNIYSLCKDIYAVNNMNTVKIFKCIFFFTLVLILSMGLVKYIKFSILFDNIINLNLTVSVGLIGLLIGSFSIVMSSTNNDTLYCLILYKEGNMKSSFYKDTLLKCMEPLIWFTLLLIISFMLKILYLLYTSINFSFSFEFVYFVKNIIVTLLLYIGFSALKSLEVFLLNMYNIISAHSRFEVMSRYVKSTHKSIDELIVDLENNLDVTDNN